MIRSAILVSMFAMPGASYALTPDEGSARITDITLFEAGLAEVSLDTGDHDSVRLRVALRDIDDVLKSLVVTGVFSENPTIRLAGESRTADAFSASPVQAESLSDVGDILSSIRGTRVRLTGLDRSAEGIVMGVSSGGECPETTPCIRVVTLMEVSGSIVKFPIDSPDGLGDFALEILDEKIVQSISAGLSALEEDSVGGVRTIRVDLGKTRGQTGLSYVVRAPIWKTAYRALVDEGEVSLQAWAVIENATPSAWEDVNLTLSAGSPINLQASLHERRWGVREDYSAQDGGMVASRKGGALIGMAESFASSNTVMAPEAADMAVTTEITETVTDSRFTFPHKLSIAAGEMISVPFLSEDLEAELYTVWDGSRAQASGSPDLILNVRNDLPVRLPAGIMTIQSKESGYIGDARFPVLVPEAKAQVAFSKEAKIKVDQETESDRFERSLEISRGVITLIDEEVRKTRYLISAPGGAAREVMVDHPYREAAKRTASGSDANEILRGLDGRQVVRYKVRTDPKSDVRLVVSERLPVRRSVQIGGTDADTLLAWSSRAGSAEDASRLKDLAKLMRNKSDTETAISRLDSERRDLVEEQARVVNILQSVPNLDKSRARYLTTLDETEDRLEEIAREKEAVLQEHDQVLKEIADMING